VTGYGPVLLVVVASALVLGLGLHEAWDDAPTFDEPVYVSAGLAAVLHHDLAFNDEHPVLTKVVAVLPVLFTHPVVPANGHWDQNDEQSYSAAFVRAQLRAGTLRSVTMASRVIPLLEAIGVAFILYALGRDLFGRAAGALAGLLWLLSPFVLGLAHLDSVDISFSLAVGCWSWALLRWTRQPTSGRAVVVGLMSGFVVLADVTGLILAGLAVVALAATLWRGSRRHAMAEAGVVALVAWASVWLVYAAIDPGVLLHPTIVLPAPYLEGIRYLAAHDSIAGPGYLLGVAWMGGRWWYWPGIMVVKTVGAPGRRSGDAPPGRPGAGAPSVASGGVHRWAAPRHRVAVPVAGDRPVVGPGHLDRASGPEEGGRGRTGRCGGGGGSGHHWVQPRLTGLDHASVHTGVPGGHQFRRRLGAVPLPSPAVE
jgi:hypothetical protein